MRFKDTTGLRKKNSFDIEISKNPLGNLFQTSTDRVKKEHLKT